MGGVVIGTDLLVKQSTPSDATRELVQERKLQRAASASFEGRLHEQALAVHLEFMQIDGETVRVKAHAAGMARAVDVRSRVSRLGHSERA
jgi:hypothetical protein